MIYLAIAGNILAIIGAVFAGGRAVRHWLAAHQEAERERFTADVTAIVKHEVAPIAASNDDLNARFKVHLDSEESQLAELSQQMEDTRLWRDKVDARLEQP